MSEEKPAEKMRCLFYCDGSVRPTNPGFGGFGIYGYTYQITDKPKNQKHPFKNNLFFSDEGVRKEKGTEPIHVHSIIEVVRSFSNASSTNNELELAAVLTAFHKSYSMKDVERITIYTDSNYIVKSFNEDLENWSKNGWRRRDGRPIAHSDEWKTLLSYKHHFQANHVEIKLIWVKGHADDYGNTIADLLANVGSNASRIQVEQNHYPFIQDVVDKTSTYAEYRASYDCKDILYFFKDLYFSSQKLDDNNYCFLGSSPDDREKGKRSNTSIFVANFGYAPPLIEKIKAFYRSIPRNFITTCCAKLSRLEDRDILRLTDMVRFDFLVRPYKSSRSNQYSFVYSDGLTGSDGVFLEESILEFPFIMNITRLSAAMYDMTQIEQNSISVYDVTDRFVKDNKLVVNNKDKFVDFSDLTLGKIVFTQKLLAAVGYDFPSYLALKRIEEEIKSVHLILQKSPESNFYSLYVKIEMADRLIYTVNVPNKYLGLPVL